jgi:1,4-alpha-glucan branching enzyme
MDSNSSKIEKRVFDITNPHGFLGLVDKRTLYQLSPNSEELFIFIKGKREKMTLIDTKGVFIYESSFDMTPLDYQVIHSDGTVGFDPYSCSPSVSLVDAHLFDLGVHYELYEVLGSHPCIHDGFEGVRFAVYAPEARAVHLRCDLGNWRETIYPMRKIGQVGIFELFIPHCKVPMMYKYSITTKEYTTLLKSDPFGRAFELRPKTATLVYKEKPFLWRDDEWLKERQNEVLSKPMNIYELHLGAWNKGSLFPNFKEIASELTTYVKEMGYTHVELMPITEYPLDESWGYQVIGYFAPTARYGKAEDFMYFINHLHMHGIGVVLDFVPAHFPKDESFLASFDGSPLFEDPHPVMGAHPSWGTLIFNYGCKKVVNFLIASLLFWIKKMHVDIIRIDAVQSILYLNYERRDGNFELNHLGGVENIKGIEFLKQLNSVVKQRHPGVFVIAEDSSIFDGVTRCVNTDGLGFAMKWNIGWFHDLSTYLSYSCEEKSRNHFLLLQTYKEVFREKYLLTISHDEVSAGKKALIDKFSTDPIEKFSYLRLLYSVAICHPGKKLFFMGHEVGTFEEFSQKNSWRKAPLKDHCQIKHKCFTKEMNHFYLHHKALYEIDFDRKGFLWVDSSDAKNRVLSFLRLGLNEKLLVVHNFSKETLRDYRVFIPGVLSIEELFNTDSIRFGGKGLLNPLIKKDKEGLFLDLPPLSTLICKVEFSSSPFFFPS